MVQTFQYWVQEPMLHDAKLYLPALPQQYQSDRLLQVFQNQTVSISSWCFSAFGSDALMCSCDLTFLTFPETAEQILMKVEKKQVLCFSEQSINKNGHAGLWLADTFWNSPLQPLKEIWQNSSNTQCPLLVCQQLSDRNRTFLRIFIRPSSDGTYYGMVMSVRPSVRPGLRPSVRPSVRPSQFSALFSYILWDIELKFCISLYYDARKSKFKCHQFPSIFDGVMPLFNFKLLQICSFPHFSPSCFDISSWKFAYDFVLLYYRISSSVVNFRQFL